MRRTWICIDCGERATSLLQPLCANDDHGLIPMVEEIP